MYTAYTRVSEIYEAQLKDIANAKRSIFLEQYILESLEEGEIGRQYVDLLIQKAKEGVHVECILDAQGAFSLYMSSKLFKELTAAGCNIFFYKTLGTTHLINPVRLILRDHRKFLIIDDEITWIGGAVIGERFMNWKDFMMRFTDPTIANVSSKEFRNQVLRLQDKLSLLAPLETISSEHHLSGNAPGIGNRFCYEEITHAIMRAQKSVVMVTPYFAPPFKLERVLRRRLKTGLSITLITPAVSDKWIANIVRERFFDTFLRRGLKVQYVPGMLHAKIVLVDDEWVTFGSTNLDPLSLIFNHELNMVSTNAEVLSEVRKAISFYLKGARLHTAKDCTYRSYGFFTRCLASVIRYLV
ncbi:MAG: phospholipase D/transphosphatidylase, cardiolipin synthase [Parcubacteria group bacterium]|nr:phospholipase D/transphosphatidylase, cardiolipin synthase [Parcubacteria group bacterium]